MVDDTAEIFQFRVVFEGRLQCEYLKQQYCERKHIALTIIRPLVCNLRGHVRYRPCKRMIVISELPVLQANPLKVWKSKQNSSEQELTCSHRQVIPIQRTTRPFTFRPQRLRQTFRKTKIENFDVPSHVKAKVLLLDVSINEPVVETRRTATD